MKREELWWLNNDQLDSCPFCGKQAYLKERNSGRYEGSFYVFCSGCYIETFKYPTVHEAVEAWNHRVGK